MNSKQEPLCFTLPGGVKIMAQACGDANPAQSGKLRIFAYDGKQEDMAYECGDFHFNNVEEDEQNG